MPEPIRLLLVEDHALVRSGLQALLNGWSDMAVIGVAGDGRAAVACVEDLKPDVVLMDISLPMLNGIEATRRVTAAPRPPRVIMLSVHANEEYVAQALAAGASGYVLKGAEAAELADAIRTVARGGRYLTPSVPQLAVDEYLRRLSQRPSPAALLTPRQREVLQLIAEGRTSREVAMLLGLGIKTVETHRAQIMQRLGVADVTALVRYAIREGLISADK